MNMGCLDAALSICPRRDGEYALASKLELCGGDYEV